MSAIAPAPWHVRGVGLIGDDIVPNIAIYGSIAAGAYVGWRLGGGWPLGIATGVAGAVVAPVAAVATLWIVGSLITGKT